MQHSPGPHPLPARVVVVGTSGAGKSTFARRLAALAGSPHVELDALHWAPDWVERPRTEFIDAVSAATTGPRWVVDGNYGIVRDIVWPRATHVVWLNFERAVVLRRVVWRTLWRSATRQRLWHGNRESLVRALFTKDSIVWWAATTFDGNRARYRALQSGGTFGHLAWAELATPRAAVAYLDGIARGAPPQSQRGAARG